MNSIREVIASPRGTFSTLQEIERNKPITLPKVLQSVELELDNKEALGAVDDHEDIEKLFPKTYGMCRVALKAASDSSSVPRNALKVAVVLSGGQASGGHNVIAGLYDFVKRVSPKSEMFGFMNGPQGIYTGKYCKITDEMMDQYRNMGGFDMIGSGRHKIESPAHFQASMENCTALDLDGLVVIGGDDSNTNAAVLAEYFAANNCKTKVCGAPKTIDGDLKVHPYIPVSFGFDTACRTYSELIGNLGQDTLSSQKYYHFVRLMGRAASNIALECALLTRPNMCLISEEVEAKKMTLSEITKKVAEMIVQRSEMGKDYGIVLLPEGLIEFIPEFNALISEINDVLAAGTGSSEEEVVKELSYNNRAVFSYLPANIKQQLLLERDPHGNVLVTKIETEKLLAQCVEMELVHLTAHGKYKGSFKPQFHSYGYEGRSCLPSEFDATYCYALGQNVGAMLNLGCNGLISSVTNLTAPVSEWECGGVPITMMCHMERRQGHMKPVIKKALVELDDLPFQVFAAQREDWAKYDLYRNPGPIQFSHSASGSHDPSYKVDLSITTTLELLRNDPRMDPALTTAAKAIQDSAPSYGRFKFVPLVGKSNELLSGMQQSRTLFKPELCPALQNRSTIYSRCMTTQPTQSTNTWDKEALMRQFSHTYGNSLVSIQTAASADDGFTYKASMNIGVVFCGRQTPGGHDIIAGVFDALPTGSKLYGFVGGTVGLLGGHAVEITAEILQNYRGQGGFDLLGRSVDRIRHSAAEHDAIAAVCKKFELDGLLLMGGSRTSTDAAYLAEAFLAKGDVQTAVVTVPLIYNGSIRNQFVETTVGFDTATRMTSQIIANNSTDGASSKKMYYFQRLIGQEPSHLALEVALNAKPNYTILAEEVKANNTKLSDIIRSIADMVEERANKGMNYGSVVIPEGLLEYIPEIGMLISELDNLFAAGMTVSESQPKEAVALVREELTMWSRSVLDSMPAYMQHQILLSRNYSGEVALSQAETERLIAYYVEKELELRAKKGTYKGSWACVCSFIGYQARGATPSNFDVNYAYNLGHVVAALVANGMSGYMATINNLKGEVAEWHASGVPITALMQSNPNSSLAYERDLHVPSSNVDLSSPSYKAFQKTRKECAMHDLYENPGPIQFSGPTSHSRPTTLQLESFDYLREIAELYAALARITEACRPGCSSTVLQIATRSLHALTDSVDMIQSAEVQKK